MSINHEERDDGIGTLVYILGEDNKPAQVTRAQHAITATVLQWLGTSIGKTFLNRVNSGGIND